MKIKATIASFLITVACCVFARATDNFSFPNSTDNNTIPAYDGVGLLIPRLDETSEDSRKTGWSRRTSNPLNLSSSKPGYRSNVRTKENSRQTASASPSSESDNRQPWTVVLITIGGLTGAIGAVAVGQWKRVNRRRRARARARAFMPAVLMANLRENQPRIAKPSETAEQHTSKTRRAA